MPETKRSPLHGLLALIAVLLALNLVVSALRPAAPVAVFPTAQASMILKTEGPQFITTNQEGNVIHVWELGRFVGDGYESVKVQSFNSSGGRMR
ncbi:MAG: hypothetical protein KF858_10750 [Candidatus Sumerlaeia bacterium]|nr:hypothetical protein [Candidatus Sumerlaeia bacterium]